MQPTRSHAPRLLAASLSALDALDKETIRIQTNARVVSAPQNDNHVKVVSSEPKTPAKTACPCLVMSDVTTSASGAIALDSRRSNVMLEYTVVPTPPGQHPVALDTICGADERKRGDDRTLSYPDALIELVCRRLPECSERGRVFGDAFAVTESWQEVVQTQSVLGSLDVAQPFADDLLERMTMLIRRVDGVGILRGACRIIAAAVLCGVDPYMQLRHAEGASPAVVTVIPFESHGHVCFLPVSVAKMEHLEQHVFGGRLVRPPGTGENSVTIMAAPLLTADGMLDPLTQFYVQRSANRRPGIAIPRATLWTNDVGSADVKHLARHVDDNPIALAEVLVHLALNKELAPSAIIASVRRHEIGLPAWQCSAVETVPDVDATKDATKDDKEPSNETLTLLSEFTADITLGERAAGYRRAPKRRKLT